MPRSRSSDFEDIYPKGTYNECKNSNDSIIDKALKPVSKSKDIKRTIKAHYTKFSSTSDENSPDSVFGCAPRQHKKVKELRKPLHDLEYKNIRQVANADSK